MKRFNVIFALAIALAVIFTGQIQAAANHAGTLKWKFKTGSYIIIYDDDGPPPSGNAACSEVNGKHLPSL